MFDHTHTELELIVSTLHEYISTCRRSHCTIEYNRVSVTLLLAQFDNGNFE